MDTNVTWENKLAEVSPENRIVLLQYNTHLFQGTAVGNLETGAEVATDLLSTTGPIGFFANQLRKKITKKNIVKLIGGMDSLILEDEKRKKSIAANIRKLAPYIDIVALNEVWSESNQKWFVEHLKDILPHHAFGHGISMGCQSSGLVLLSRYPIEQASPPFIFRSSPSVFRNKQDEKNYRSDPSEYEYLKKDVDERTKLLNDIKFEEKHANKGVLMAKICGPDGKSFLISISHTAGFVDIAELIDYTKVTAQKIARDCAIIITGDLNVHQSKQAKSDLSKRMVDMFKNDLGATDVWGMKECTHFSDEKGNTINNVENMLFRKLHPSRNPSADSYSNVDRLDYVFFANPPNSNEAKLKPVAARVIPDWSVKTKIDDKIVDLDLSDHYPLQVLFSIE